MNPLSAAWLCWAIVGLSPVVGKYAAAVVNPALLGLLSSLLAVLFFAPQLIAQRNYPLLFSRRNRAAFWFIGTFGTAFPFTLILYALHYTTPGNAAILQQTEIIFSLLFSFFVLKEKFSLQSFAATLLIVAGVLLILLKEPFSARWKGDGLIVISACMFQAASCVAKKLPQQVPAGVIAAARNLYALPALAVLCAMWAWEGKLFLQPGLTFSAVLFYTAFLKYGAAMMLWYWAILRLDLSKVTAIYLSYPLLSLMLSIALGLDTPQTNQWIGLTLTLCGAYWISFILKKQQEQK